MRSSSSRHPWHWAGAPPDFDAGSRLEPDKQLILQAARLDSGQNHLNHPVSGIDIIQRNEFPNFIEFNTGFRMKFVSSHELWARTTGGCAFLAKISLVVPEDNA